jgi:hypothetical protein
MKQITGSAVAAGTLDHIVIAAGRNYFSYPPQATVCEIEEDLERHGFMLGAHRSCLEWAVAKANGIDIEEEAPAQLCLLEWSNIKDDLEVCQ